MGDLIQKTVDVGKRGVENTVGRIPGLKGTAGFLGDPMGLGTPGKNNGGGSAGYFPLMTPISGTQVDQGYSDTQSGLVQQQAFLNALAAQNGVGNQSNVYNQLAGVASGTGPNPAMQQLQNTTAQNVANQAALMASQRGSSSNAGLLARQAGMQGANIQQQAVGQGAALQAQQQLAALGQMGDISQQQVQNYGTASQNLNQFSQNEQSNLLNALANYNSAGVSMQSNANNVNAGLAGQQIQANANVTGGLLQGAGSVLAAYYGAAEGGLVDKGTVTPPGGPRSSAAKHLLGLSSYTLAPNPLQLSRGSVVPGKAPVPGNSYKNDTVPAMLSPGEVVIPRSVMQSKNPSQAAAKFVEAIMKKRGAK